MPHPQYPFEALADLPNVPFAPMRQMILAQAASSALPVLEDDVNRLTVETAHGLVGLRPGRSAPVAGMVAARDQRWLFVMKGAVIAQLRQVMPDVAASMRWSDGDAPGALPPNFQFVRVRHVERLGPVFLRVTLEGEDFSAHGDNAIHFRLVLPPLDAEPQWPTVAANGSIAWPEGPRAPHRPIYTARAVDHSARTLTTDVYIHEGGRTTNWARELMEGDQTRSIVGLVGPSGGGLLTADHVLMASDETGFPALARLIEGLPKDAVGEIILEADDGDACAYPIPSRSGLTRRWLKRRDGEKLVTATTDALPAHEGASIWFAGEKSDARSLRETAKAQGFEPNKLRISAFWTAPTPA